MAKKKYHHLQKRGNFYYFRKGDCRISLETTIATEAMRLRDKLLENFRLYGGSEETHQLMQEKAVKFNEQLDRHGKSLDKISTKEFYDIAHQIGLKIPTKSSDL